MFLLPSVLISSRIIMYAFRLFMVWMIRRGKFTTNQNARLEVFLDTPALTNERDDIKRISVRALEKIGGVSESDSLVGKKSFGMEEIFPVQKRVLKEQTVCVGTIIINLSNLHE